MLNQENLTAIKIAIEKEIKLGKKQVGWKLGFGSQAGLKAFKKVVYFHTSYHLYQFGVYGD